jgi:hypothetical protein
MDPLGAVIKRQGKKASQSTTDGKVEMLRLGMRLVDKTWR